MPRGRWSAKDERMYAHVLKSCKKKRRGEKDASKTCKRIASATVNMHRGRRAALKKGGGRRRGLKGPCEDAIMEARRALDEAQTPAQRRAAQKFMNRVKSRCGLTEGLRSADDGWESMSAANLKRLKEAQALARLLRKAGTSAEGAEQRLRERYELTDTEWRGIARSTWGVSVDGLRGYAINTSYGNDECSSEGIITKGAVYRVLYCGEDAARLDMPRFSVFKRELREDEDDPVDVVTTVDSDFVDDFETDDPDEFRAYRERLLALEGLTKK